MSPEEKVDAAIERAYDQGLHLWPGGWGIKRGEDKYECYGNRICPMGAILIGEPISHTKDLPDLIAEILDVSLMWIREFVLGFDDLEGLHSRDYEGYLLGLRYRHKWQAVERQAMRDTES